MSWLRAIISAIMDSLLKAHREKKKDDNIAREIPAHKSRVDDIRDEYNKRMLDK